jgi:hypothetical protein
LDRGLVSGGEGVEVGLSAARLGGQTNWWPQRKGQPRRPRGAKNERRNPLPHPTQKAVGASNTWKRFSASPLLALPGASEAWKPIDFIV